MWRIHGEENLDRTVFLLGVFRGSVGWFEGRVDARYGRHLDMLVEEAGVVDVFGSRALNAMEFFRGDGLKGLKFEGED